MTATDYHRESAFVGIPWRSGASGPFHFDCWHLARRAARELYGIQFPEIVYTPEATGYAENAKRATLKERAWQRIEMPEAGAILALSFGTAGNVAHVALCLDDHRALHTERRLGSMIVPNEKLFHLYGLEGIYKWPQ